MAVAGAARGTVRRRRRTLQFLDQAEAETCPFSATWMWNSDRGLWRQSGVTSKKEIHSMGEESFAPAHRMDDISETVHHVIYFFTPVVECVFVVEWVRVVEGVPVVERGWWLRLYFSFRSTASLKRSGCCMASSRISGCDFNSFQIHVHRRAAQVYPTGYRPPAHKFQPDRGAHGAPFVVQSQPAEHPHRRRIRVAHPLGVCRGAWLEDDFCGLLANRTPRARASF